MSRATRRPAAPRFSVLVWGSLGTAALVAALVPHLAGVGSADEAPAAVAIAVPEADSTEARADEIIARARANGTLAQLTQMVGPTFGQSDRPAIARLTHTHGRYGPRLHQTLQRKLLGSSALR